MIYLLGEHTCASHELRLRVCDSFWSRLLGALPEGGIDERDGILLTECSRVHTWFMRRSIAVMFLTESGRVTGYHPRVKPFRMVSGGPRTSMTLELAPKRLDREVLKKKRVQLRLDPSTALRLGMPDWTLDRADRETGRLLRNV